MLLTQLLTLTFFCRGEGYKEKARSNISMFLQSFYDLPVYWPSTSFQSFLSFYLSNSLQANVALFQLKATTQPHRQMTAVRLADCREASSLSLHFHPPDFLPQSLWLWKKKKKATTNICIEIIPLPGAWIKSGLHKTTTGRGPLLLFPFFFLLLNMCKDACEQKGGGADEQPVNTLADTRSSSRRCNAATLAESCCQKNENPLISLMSWLLILFCDSASQQHQQRHFSTLNLHPFSFSHFFFFFLLACMSESLPPIVHMERAAVNN